MYAARHLLMLGWHRDAAAWVWGERRLVIMSETGLLWDMDRLQRCCKRIVLRCTKGGIVLTSTCRKEHVHLVHATVHAGVVHTRVVLFNRHVALHVTCRRLIYADSTRRVKFHTPVRHLVLLVE